MRPEHVALVERFVRDQGRWLRHLAARLVGRTHADDVAQDALVSLIAWIVTHPPSTATELLEDLEQTRRLMCRLTACRAYDHLRRLTRRKALGDGVAIVCDVADGATVNPHATLELEGVERAYAALPALQRIAHVFHYYYGFTDTDLETMLGISRTTCRTLVYRANRALKRALKRKP